MLYNFEKSVYMFKNKSCSNDLNIYKTKNEPIIKVIISQVNLIQNKKN